MQKTTQIGRIIVDNMMRAVHDDDLEQFLKSLDSFDAVIQGEKRCLLCGKIITMANIGAIIPHENEVCFICNESDCYDAMANSERN